MLAHRGKRQSQSLLKVVTGRRPEGEPGEIPQVGPPEPRAELFNNLPVPTTSFVGRREDAERVTALLRSSRLVTITAGGGLGKTRLAIRVAHSLAADYPHGAWFVDLAPLSDPALVPNAISSALSIRQESRREAAEAVLSYLKRRRLLLVLDNCEHLLQTCAGLAHRILQSCPEVSILVTSREPLGMVEESVVKLSPLPVPPPGEESFSVLKGYESVQLFTERATSTHPGFALTEPVAPGVAEICRRLDGIPLAIELAAARMEALSPSEVVWRLEDRFRFLRRGNRGALPRHQTLESALDWSHDLLTAGERALFRRLAVFTGPFSAEAAEEVCSNPRLPRREISGHLEQLVAKSLVVAEHTPAGVRFGALETVRQYALAKLDSAQGELLRQAHAVWYLQLVESAELQLAGPEQQLWVERLESEHDNLRAALEWGIANQPEQGLRLAAALTLFWRLRGHWSEGREWLSRALKDTKKASPAVRAKALWGLGLLAGLMADYPEAAPAAEKSLALYRKSRDQAGSARALGVLGLLSIFRPAQALPILEESIALARLAGDRWCLAESLVMAGQAHTMMGRVRQGRQCFEEALEVARASGDKRGVARALIGMGWTGSVGGAASSKNDFEQGLEMARSVGEPYEAAQALVFLADVVLQEGDLDRAHGLFEESLRLAKDIGSPLLEARVLGGLGRLALAQGQPPAAAAFFDQAIEAARDAQLSFILVRALMGRGVAALHSGDLKAAQSLWSEALEIAQSESDKEAVASCLMAVAGVAKQGGDDEKAGLHYYEALALFADLGDRVSASAALAGLGAVAVMQGRFPAAARLFGAANAAAEAVQPGSARRLIGGQFQNDLVTDRKALGDSRFDAAWAEGGRMSFEDAVAYASRGRGGREDRPVTGWGSLTKVEKDVAALVAEGLTNKEIGERLFISPGTARIHVSHILAKLGVSSRKEVSARRQPAK